MYRVKSIETILGYASLYKPSCPIIQIYNHASHYSANHPIVHHQNKCAKKLHTSTIWKRVTISIKKIRGNNYQNPSPFIIHSKPESESGHAKCPKESQYQTTLQKIFKNHQCGHSQSQCKHHIMYPVSTIQQIPGYFTDYGKAQQSKEIPVPASAVNKPFRYQEGKHWKSDAPDTAHRFV